MRSKRETKAARARNANLSRQAGVHVLCLVIIRLAADSVAADAILDEGIAPDGPSGPEAHEHLSMSLWPRFARVSRPTQRLSVPRTYSLNLQLHLSFHFNSLLQQTGYIYIYIYISSYIYMYIHICVSPPYATRSALISKP